MSNTNMFQRLICGAALCVNSCLVGGLLCVPLATSAEQSSISAQMVQRLVTAIETRFTARKPLLERNLQEGESGSHISAWGTPNLIEKISAKYQGERGETLQDFYWEQGVLIAARLRRIDYGAYVGEFPASKPLARNVLEDERFEFSGDVVLRRRSFGRIAPVDAVNVNMVLAELKAGALSYKRLMDIPETKANRRGNCSWSCAREEADICLAYECK
jgi:hypothetical protein